MNKKLRQVTDNIHGTIYLSEIESRMMSTPFFYRLHDIYQSSTVYMAFPANRTKRYEHCLGTMELAGQMFYYAITNASREVRKQFVDSLCSELRSILQTLKRRKVDSVFYFKNDEIKDMIAQILPEKVCNIETIKSYISKGMREGTINDLSLNHQKVCFFDLLQENNNSSSDDVLLGSFLYQCALEAIRLSSLFHDVGHPPYSHIIEETMVNLYNECSKGSRSDIDTKKGKMLRDMLTPFMSNSAPKLLLRTSGVGRGSDGEALHEQIGLRMLQSAFNGVMKEQFLKANEEESHFGKVISILYLILIVEFTFAILLEKKPIFASMHRILDGSVDADRLDYIVRDTENAGINWGHVPYKRLVCSVRFITREKGTFSIAFPEKMTDDLDDIIVARYKIFGRINYHHRSNKTATLLKTAVRILAEDYLCTPYAMDSSSGENTGGSICPEIKDLWCALGAALGQKEMENKAAKWNDSWLISILHGALIKLSNEANLETLCNGRSGRTKDDLHLLRDLLDEVLLNHKHYFAVLKRQRDANKLMLQIREKAGLTDEKLAELLDHEYDKLTKSGSDFGEAIDSLRRIQELKDKIFQNADFEMLEVFFPDCNCGELIENILKVEKANHVISDYFMSPNEARNKLGISHFKEKDDIYLYTPNGNWERYDILNTLYPILQAHRTANLWLNVYVNLATTQNEVDVIGAITEKIADTIGKKMAEQFRKLFPSISF